MAEFNERLRELRNKDNKSIRKTAEILNVSRTTLSRYERGERSPNKEFLEKAADYYGVSVDYLLGRSDMKNIEEKVKAMVPNGTLELLDREDKEFLRDLVQDEQRQLLMRETRGMDKEDLAKFIRMARAFEEEQDD